MFTHWTCCVKHFTTSSVRHVPGYTGVRTEVRNRRPVVRILRTTGTVCVPRYAKTVLGNAADVPRYGPTKWLVYHPQRSVYQPQRLVYIKWVVYGLCWTDVWALRVREYGCGCTVVRCHGMAGKFILSSINKTRQPELLTHFIEVYRLYSWR